MPLNKETKTLRVWFFTHGHIEYEFLNKSIWLLLGTLTGVTTFGQSWPRSNRNGGVHYTSHISRTIRCSLVSYFRTPPFGESLPSAENTISIFSALPTGMIMLQGPISSHREYDSHSLGYTMTDKWRKKRRFFSIRIRWLLRIERD